GSLEAGGCGTAAKGVQCRPLGTPEGHSRSRCAIAIADNEGATGRYGREDQHDAPAYRRRAAAIVGDRRRDRLGTGRGVGVAAADGERSTVRTANGARRAGAVTPVDRGRKVSRRRL